MAEAEREVARLREELETLRRRLEEAGLPAGRRRPSEVFHLGERERALMETIRDGVYILDTDQKILFVNRVIQDRYGQHLSWFIGRDAWTIMGPENEDTVRPAFGEVVRENRSVVFEFSHVDTDGRLVWVESHAAPLREDERVVGVIGVSRDITPRRRAERELRRSEETYRALVQSSPDAILLFDLEGRFVEVSPRLLELGGFERPDEVLGRSVLDFVAPGRRDEAREALEEAARRGGTRNRVLELLRRDGSSYEGEVNATVYRGPEGRPVGFVAVVRDVTERQAMERSLRESEEKYRLLLEALPHPVVILQKDRVAFVSSAAREVFRIPDLEAVLGRSPDPFLGEGERSVLQRRLLRRLEGADDLPRRFTATLRRADGEEFPAELFVQPLLYEGLPSAQYVVMDISDRLRLEEQLRHSQKMEAIGTLAGGIAHDFNNLLTGIIGCASVLRQEAGGDPDVAASIEVIESAAEKAAELTRQLLGFARRGKLRNVPVDVHRVTAEVMALLARTLERSIRLQPDLRARPCFVQGDPVQIQQVVMNLAVNARDAMPGGGDLGLRTRVESLAPGRPPPVPGLPAGAYLLLEVSDTGTGVPEAVRDRLFEPFFTTKPPGEGTGMGLAVVYGIVQNHGGAVRVQSAEGRGATFQVYLPLLGAPEEEAAEAVRPPVHYGSGRILVVDDEDLVLRAAEKMLASLGYEVVTARGGAEALDYYRVLGDDIDLVLLDLIMPHPDGAACFRALQKADPAARVLLTTGHALEGTLGRLIDEGARGVLRKPFVLEDLSRAVAEALA